MRARLALGLLLTSGGVAAAVAACSLGLDEAKIGGLGDGGADGAPLLDGGSDADAANPIACQNDPDCKPANACLTGRCDKTRNICLYDLCPAAACKASVCNGTTKTCSVPTSYGFHAGSFKVTSGGVGCGGAGAGARRCFAAVYPFVFVGTTNGVVAYSVADPTDSAPAALPVAGLPFFPQNIVASGTRVYFVGAVVGNYKVPIAWVDVPGDPTVAKLSATTVFNSLQLPSIDRVFPDTTGGVYLVHDSVPKSYPAARVTAPLKDLDALTFFATAGLPAGAVPFAASGTRLVTYRQEGNPTWAAYFSLEPNAATGSAQNLLENSLVPSFGNSFAPTYFSQGSDGSLVFNTGSVNAPDGGPATLTATRLGWIIEDAGVTKIEATAKIDVEKYGTNPGVGADVPGPVAWLDANRALVLAASAANTSQTAVQLATRDPQAAMVANRRFVLPFLPSLLAATASNGFGYVLVPDAPDSATVHLFGSGCDN